LVVVERNARLLLKHVNDLLDISKLEAGRMRIIYESVDLTHLSRFVASHFDVLAQERRINFSVMMPDVLRAQVDAEKVQRILLNLLSNAFKFAPAGGRIGLTLEEKEGRAVFQVRDSGPGVPPELRDVIFHRFRQLDGGSNRQYGGTGLGLSIVKEFVDLHGGRVFVGSASDAGAIFTLELPLRAPSGSEVRDGATELEDEIATQAVEELRTVADPRTKSPEGVPIGITPLILVVEDNPDMNSFIAETLAGTYRVITAFDGQEGLERALRHRPDLILSDVMMPRMSGEQMILEFRTHRDMDNVPIVLLTAKADDDLRIRLLKEGAQDYLNKPFSAEELLARVERHIAESKRAEDAILDREERLRQANLELQKRNEEMEQFVFTIAHDLKSPLVTVQGFAGYVEHDVDEGRTDRLKEFAHEMIVASRRMASMIDELLDLSRVGRVTNPSSLVSMNEIVDEILHDHAERIAAMNVRVEVQKLLPVVLVDRERIVQVFDNLVVNALNYGCTGTEPKIQIGYRDNEREHLFFVRDNGVGIQPKYHEKIFQLFQRLDLATPGTGVGLAIARRITEHHGGRLWVESESGQGATFWVSLPIPESDARESSSSMCERI
jgi:signal transduction histidine kinase